jgi:hypothetical protein
MDAFPVVELALTINLYLCWFELQNEVNTFPHVACVGVRASCPGDFIFDVMNSMSGGKRKVAQTENWLTLGASNPSLPHVGITVSLPRSCSRLIVVTCAVTTAAASTGYVTQRAPMTMVCVAGMIASIAYITFVENKLQERHMTRGLGERM